MTTDIERVRLMVGEKIPDGGSDADTFFTDEEIDGLLATSFDVYGAAAEGWLMKAARYSDLVDIDESGSTRKLSQRFRQSLAMSQHFMKQSMDSSDAIIGRVVGKVVNLGNDLNDPLGVLGPFGNAVDVIREYPLFRFPGILQ